MASLLSSVGSPITRHRFVERRKRTELYAVFLFIMSAHVYQIMGERFIVFRFQVVGRRIGMACTTSAVSHVVGAGIAEGLEYGIRTLLFDFQHDFPLCGITAPNVFTVRTVFETFHFRTQAFSASHVVRRAVPVLRVVSPADVVAENTVVQSVRADQPIHKFVYLLVAPLPAHVGPPAERDAPSLELLTGGGRVDDVDRGVGRRSLMHVGRKIPQMPGVRPVFVRIHG